MAGIPITKYILNSRVGYLTKTLRDTFTEIARVKKFLDDTSDADLVALGFSQSEVTLIKAAFTDLNKLGRIAAAQDTHPAANDFYWNAGNLTGSEQKKGMDRAPVH